jgi:hypothetical protein
MEVVLSFPKRAKKEFLIEPYLAGDEGNIRRKTIPTKVCGL